MEIWSPIIGGSFVIGAIFWAGATYSRIGRIEKDLATMVEKVSLLGGLDGLKEQIHTHDKEIVMLRKTVYGDLWRMHNSTSLEEEGTK